MSPKIDMAEFVTQFAGEMRKLAEEAGTDCDMPGCNALTLGVRCNNCSRRLCNGHAFLNLSGARVTPYCIYCAVALNQNLFGDADDDDDDDIVDGDEG